MNFQDRPSLLLVDDRPCTFTNYILARSDIDVHLLRFEDSRADLPQSYLTATEDRPSFWVNDKESLEHEADRYRKWLVGSENRPTRFCNPSEPHQEAAQEFAREVGLPHLTSTQVRWVRNKADMKRRLREVGLRTAEYARVSSKSDVDDFGRVNGWPVVLKPVDSFACIDTFLLNNRAELESQDLPDRPMMVESYQGGTEGECCALIQDGRVLDVWPSFMPSRPLEMLDGAMNANISDRLLEHSPSSIRETVEAIVRAFQIDHGYLHMEYFFDGHETVVGEVGLRIAGCEITANHGLAYGFDVFGATLDVYLGRRPNLSYTGDRVVGDLLLPMPESGVITEITASEKLKRLPGVVEANIRVQRGDLVSTRRASHHSAGYVHVAGGSVADVQSRMQVVLDTFELVVHPTLDG